MSSDPTQPDAASDEAEYADDIDLPDDVTPIADRIGAFASYTLAADLLELREIYAELFKRLDETDWLAKTDKRAQGWTLHETVAHLDAVAWAYNTAVAAGLTRQVPELPGLTRREELAEANKAQIAQRLDQPIDQLCASFLDQLSEGARLASPLTIDQLSRKVEVPFYGSTPTIAELLGASLAHAGVIHAAQVAVGKRDPLWVYYRPGLMRRQFTRLIHLIGLAYWPERGGDLRACIAIEIAGVGGGSWYLCADPVGGFGRIGVVERPALRLRFAGAELFCRFLTMRVNLPRQILFRRIRINGDLRLAMRLTHYFSPS
jgi:hypothetical protein